MFDDELDSFKRIDLRVFAAAQGYQLDKRKSSKGSSVMRHANNDKIIIKRSGDGHYVYASVRDDRDRGTIIDFVQNRERVSIGAVRKMLRPWIGVPPVPAPQFPALVKTPRDRLRVEAEFAKMGDAKRHPYLEGERALPASLLASSRFAGRVRIDSRGNAVFPHFDAEGLCGFEIKNRGFTGFAVGGNKGLWLSHEYPSDRRLIFCESAIDAISFAALFPDNLARYASISGRPTPLQAELIGAAVGRMPQGAEIIAAMDADAAGRELVEIVGKAVHASNRHDVRFAGQEPVGFKDWNDQLLREKQPEISFPAAQPSLKVG